MMEDQRFARLKKLSLFIAETKGFKGSTKVHQTRALKKSLRGKKYMTHFGKKWMRDFNKKVSQKNLPPPPSSPHEPSPVQQLPNCDPEVIPPPKVIIDSIPPPIIRPVYARNNRQRMLPYPRVRFLTTPQIPLTTMSEELPKNVNPVVSVQMVPPTITPEELPKNVDPVVSDQMVPPTTEQTQPARRLHPGYPFIRPVFRYQPYQPIPTIHQVIPPPPPFPILHRIPAFQPPTPYVPPPPPFPILHRIPAFQPPTPNVPPPPPLPMLHRMPAFQPPTPNVPLTINQLLSLLK